MVEAIALGLEFPGGVIKALFAHPQGDGTVARVTLQPFERRAEPAGRPAQLGKGLPGGLVRPFGAQWFGEPVEFAVPEQIRVAEPGEIRFVHPMILAI